MGKKNQNTVSGKDTLKPMQAVEMFEKLKQRIIRFRDGGGASAQFIVETKKAIDGLLGDVELIENKPLTVTAKIKDLVRDIGSEMGRFSASKREQLLEHFQKLKNIYEERKQRIKNAEGSQEFDFSELDDLMWELEKLSETISSEEFVNLRAQKVKDMVEAAGVSLKKRPASRRAPIRDTVSLKTPSERAKFF